MTALLITRLLARVDAFGDCWEWTGKRNSAGYGVFDDRVAHRRLYQELVGPVAADLELDHLCRNRGCVNPDHLEPVTHAENSRRSAAGQVNRLRILGRTHCARGHAWTEANTKRTARQRKCRSCIREDSATARRRRGATAA